MEQDQTRTEGAGFTRRSLLRDAGLTCLATVAFGGSSWALASPAGAVSSTLAAAGPLPAADTTPPVVPSAADTAWGDAARRRHGLPTTSFSDLYSLTSTTATAAGGAQTVSQRAMTLLSEAYGSSAEVSWSDRHRGAVQALLGVQTVAFANQTDAAIAARTKLLWSYKLMEFANQGCQANALYSFGTPSTLGGDENFPVYPADARFIVNGASSPGGAGEQRAAEDMKVALGTAVVSADLVNAVLFEVDGKAKVGSEVVRLRAFATRLYTTLTSPNYPAYVAEMQGSGRGATAAYWTHKEMTSLAVLSPDQARAATVIMAANTMRVPFDRALSSGGPSFPEQDPALQITSMQYVFERIDALLAASAVGTLGSVAAAIGVINDLLATDRASVAGLAKNTAVLNTFIKLTNYDFTGQSAGVYTSQQLNAAIAAASNATFTNDITFRNRFVNAVTSLNSSGVLGGIAGFTTIAMLALESLNMQKAIADGTYTPDQAIAVAARVAGLYSSIGAFGELFGTITRTGPRVLRFIVTKLGWTKSVKGLWDLDSTVRWGAMGSNAVGNTPSGAAITLQDLERALADTVTEQTSLIETEFVAVSRAASSSVSSSIPASARAVVTLERLDARAAASADTMVTVARAEGYTLSKTVATLAAKAFTISMAAAGVLESVLDLAADAYALATGASMTPTMQLSLTADIFAVVGSSLSLVGALVSVDLISLTAAAAGPLAILGIGLTLVSAVVRIIGTALARNDASNELIRVRAQVRNDLEHFQSAGYLSDWGVKIAFLSVYFDRTRDPNARMQQRRWTAASASIFEDERAAWSVFRGRSGSDFDRFWWASRELVRVSQTVRTANNLS